MYIKKCHEFLTDPVPFKDVKTLLQLLKSLALLSVAAFCAYGFLASFEPGNSPLWKAGYGLLGSTCLIWFIAMWRQKP